ncbi:hypothetical protein I3F58_26000, partial [Streptomyces sp. MUM 203J]|nr:hypothetical protein [Streptomyces sp. MUM 203J]
MSRRVSLPGADELFRTTGGMPLQASSPRRPAGAAAEGDAAPETRVPGPATGSGAPAAPGGAPGASSEEHGTASGEPGDAAERSRGREAAEDEQGRAGGPAARAAARAAKSAGG